MSDTYRDDLAAIHDVGFGGFARSLAPALLDRFRRAGLVGGRVVDLGCGSGIWAECLVGAGYDVLGVDLSGPMLAIARGRAPGAEFRRASFLEVDLPDASASAVTALGEVLNYRFDPSNDLDRLAALFRRVHRALKPGGLFVFDLLVTRPSAPRGEVLRHREGDGWATLVTVRVEGDELTRRITSFRRVGPGPDSPYRRDHEVHRQRLYPAAAILHALRAAGFRATAGRRLGPHRFDPAHRVFVARKPPRPARPSGGRDSPRTAISDSPNFL